MNNSNGENVYDDYQELIESINVTAQTLFN